MSDKKEILVLNVLASALGLLVAYAFIAFKNGIGFFQNLILQNQISFENISFKNNILGIWILLLPPIAFIFIAAINKIFAPEASGASIPLVIEATKKKNILRGRLFFVKGLTSTLTIASGGSAGKEGALVQMAASLSLSLAKIFRLPKDSSLVLLSCAAAAGLAAALNTPIAAVIFAVEVFKVKTKSLVPLLSAVFFASLVARSYYGSSLEFLLPSFRIESPVEILFYLGLGLLAGLYAFGFNKSFLLIEKKISLLKIHYLWKAMLGGFVISIIGYFYPQSMGLGLETLVDTLRGHTAISLLIALLILKPLCLSITLSSGGSGGMIAPILFIGAILGATYGFGMAQIFPNLILNYGPYALVGMAALFAASTRSTFTAIAILFEITMEYSIVLPLFLTCMLAEQVASLLKNESIFYKPLRK